MKFAPLYKNITLTVEGKCVKYTKVYKTPKRFCMIFKQLELNIRNNFLFFYFLLPKYVIKTFSTKINI